jgi:two-component system chemotaxis sensor kinase CheA
MDATSKSQLMARLMETFASEADERLQVMSQELLMLEGSTDPHAVASRLESLLREAHSLKGAARTVNASRAEALGHRLESLFEQMRSGEPAPEPPVCDVIYKVLDALGQLVREAVSGEPADVPVDALAAMLDRPELGVTDRHAAASQPPPPSEPPPEPLPEPPSEPPPRKPPLALPLAREPVAAAPPSPEPAPAPKPAAAPTGDTVRMPTAKLDSLLADVGELAVAQAGSVQQLAALRALAEELQTWETAARRRRTASRSRGSGGPAGRLGAMSDEDWDRLRSMRQRVVAVHRVLAEAGRRAAQATAELEDEVRRSRMLPVSSILDAFPRMVRDIAREQDKQVEFVVSGAGTEVDRSLLEQLRAPLTHVVRNSIDHGIERVDVRIAAGKPPKGTISVSAHQQGGALSVEVTDDGAGIDLARVRAKAVDRGLCTDEAVERMSDREAMSLIYRSGFSTAPMITDLSGRGVGLDVVREHIERLHGMIDVDSSAGSGTRFRLVLPLSVSTTPCLLLGVAGQSFALPVTNVSRIVTVADDAVKSVEGMTVLSDDGTVVALTDLAGVLGIERGDAHPVAHPSPAILLGSADRRLAFLVDDLIGLESVVTKSLPAPLFRVRHLSGATILGTGEVITILNAANLIRTASPQRDDERAAPAIVPRVPVVLLVEDSITTLALEKNILEVAGYEVRAAGDGLEAWRILEQGGIDIVVSDVYMSGMDGFELTAKLRGDDRLARVPVVLVTSKDSRRHRERGVAVGANAYIVKGSFEQQNLVDAVARLV